MTSLATLLEELKSTRAGGDTGQARRFAETVVKVCDLAHPQALPALASLLDDDESVLHPHMGWTLLHAIEGEDDVSYVRGLLAVTEGLAERAPGWTETLYIRILNSSSCRLALAREAVVAGPNTRGAVLAVMSRIAAGDADLAGKVAKFLQLLRGEGR